MVIHGPETIPYDIGNSTAVLYLSSEIANMTLDVGPIILSDYYHQNYYSLVEKVVSTDINSIVSLHTQI
jgi:hypothetical protein